uniref:Uncharacterized protein n=1 Tax=Hordeum vulgare subsp. vulgare TaxID=112509 RepID=A0A8I6WI62_HORVV
MYVVKRDGWTETVHFDKITARLNKPSYEGLRRGIHGRHLQPARRARRRDRRHAQGLLARLCLRTFPLSIFFSPFGLFRSPLTAPVFVSPGLMYVRVWFFCSSRRGLLCPTCRQVEIVCVVLVNREHSGRKVHERIGKLLSFSLVSEK